MKRPLRRLWKAAAMAGLLLVALAPAASAAPSPPFAQCPAVGADSGCALLIDITPSGQVGVYGDPSQGPFDGTEDTLIGVQNDSSTPLSSIPLQATTGKPLFGFDGDGLCAYGITGCPLGTTGYEGPGVSFSDISSDTTGGVVKFSPAIPQGGTAYFSLEEALATQPPYDLAPGTPNAGSGIVLTPHIADQANEPTVAVNPNNPNEIAVAYNHFVNGSDVRCAYQYTTDGGQTWHGPTDLPLPSIGHATGAGDPSLAYASDGSLWFSCLTNGDADALGTATQLYAAVRPAGQTQFGPPRLLVNGNSQGTGPDQEDLAAAPSGGEVYVCYTFYAAGDTNSGIRVAQLAAQSSGSGTVPVVVNKASASAGTRQVNPVGCTVSVAPSGRVWTAWWDAHTSRANKLTDTGELRAYAAYSDNRGSSFTGVTMLGVKRGVYGASGPGFYPQRRVDIQASPVLGDNRVLAVWEDGAASGDNLLQAVYSGSNWASATTIASGATQPSVSWGADGKAVYGYYSNPNADGSQLFYGIARTSGPATGTLPFVQASTPASSELTGLAPSTVPRFGDYNGVAEGNGSSWGVWTDNSVGHQTVTLGQLP